MIHSKNKTGFTLIELLITMSFIGIISIVITTVYITGFNTYRQELASSIVQSDGQTILDGLLLDVKNGMLIEPAYDSYTTDADTIIIRVPAIDTSKHIIYDGTNMLYDEIIYDYDGTSIHKRIFADPASTRYPKNGIDTILAKNVLELSFTYDPDQSTATLITAIIHSSVKAGNKNRDITLTGQARLRNHI
jgi:prepilin-type N-terminal cleavage/methylation domain-containing protein